MAHSAIVIGLALAFYFGFLFADSNKLRAYVESSGILGPLIFIVLKISTNVIAPLSGTPFYLIAKPLFGVWRGMLYVYIGEVTGYCICFLLARYYGRAVVTKIAGQNVTDKINEYYNDLGNKRGLFYSRIFLIGIQDVVSYAAGLTSIPFKEYLAITAIGIIPQTGIAVITGGIIAERAPALFILYFIITTLLLPIIWIYRRKRRTIDRK